MTATTTVVPEDSPPFGQDRCLVQDEFAVAQAAGVFHKILMVKCLIPIFNRAVGLFQGSGQALSAMADGAAEFFEIMRA